MAYEVHTHKTSNLRLDHYVEIKEVILSRHELGSGSFTISVEDIPALVEQLNAIAGWDKKVKGLERVLGPAYSPCSLIRADSTAGEYYCNTHFTHAPNGVCPCSPPMRRWGP